MQEWNHHADTGRAAELSGNVLDSGTPSGLIDRCEVVSEAGWHPVGDLRPGDRAMTLDHGLQEVQAVERLSLWTGPGDCPETLWPLFLPAGLIGNSRELMVLPDQAVRLPFGDPKVLVPALALAGLAGVERTPPFTTIEVVRPMFERDQLVLTDGGALLYCPASWSPLYNMLRQDKAEYHVATASEASVLVEAIGSFTDRPVTFPPDLWPDAPVNQDNYPARAKIA